MEPENVATVAPHLSTGAPASSFVDEPEPVLGRLETAFTQSVISRRADLEQAQLLGR